MRSFASIMPAIRSVEIVGPRADEFRQGIAVVVTFAQEDAVRSQARRV